jgi:glycosyltransferase involved in cell wall biosynthesis
MRKTRVLEIVEATGGGVLRHLFQIVEGLDYDLFDVTVALSSRGWHDLTAMVERIERAGARAERVEMLRHISPIADLRAARALTELIRCGRFDVVHAHSSKAGFLGRLAARRAGVSRLFYTPHAYAFQCGGLRGRIYLAAERFARRFGGTTLAVGEGERDLSIGRVGVPSDRVRVVANSIALPDPVTPERRASARDSLGLPRDAVVFGTVARLDVQKGVERMVELAARNEPSGAIWAVIGDGPLRVRLEELARRSDAAGRVRLLGRRDRAAELCAAFDVYLQPSRWEGLPYSILDALGLGLPVLATDIPGHREVCSLAVNWGPALPDPELLRELATAPRFRPPLESSRCLVRERHSLAGFIAALTALYCGDE